MSKYQVPLQEKPTSPPERGCRQCGPDNVALKIDADGRHEMLNETCCDEVTADVLDWIDAG